MNEQEYKPTNKQTNKQIYKLIKKYLKNAINFIKFRVIM